LVLLVSATSLHASSVITCSETAITGNTCAAAQGVTFNANLQWNALGSATGIPFTSTTSGITGGITVGVSDANGQMILADNYGLINRNGRWIDPSFLPTAPYRFSGHFDAPPDSTTQFGAPVGSPGDYLVGTYQNNQALTISLSGAGVGSGLQGFAFRIAANSLSVFDVTIQEYSGPNGTGLLLGSQTFSSLTGGGNCPGLFHNPPQPCNDAPWVVGSGFGGLQGIQSLVIHTSDTSGFYIDTFYMEAVPEPGTMFVAGIGMLGLGYAIRRQRATKRNAKS
jgi:hypothetical protein